MESLMVGWGFDGGNEYVRMKNTWGNVRAVCTVVG
jgi:hypothetical protein